MTPRCRICGIPIIFVPLFGWAHLAYTEDGHKAEESR